jgi:hypothetical protein
MDEDEDEGLTFGSRLGRELINKIQVMKYFTKTYAVGTGTSRLKALST